MENWFGIGLGCFMVAGLGAMFAIWPRQMCELIKSIPGEMERRLASWVKRQQGGQSGRVISRGIAPGAIHEAVQRGVQTAADQMLAEQRAKLSEMSAIYHATEHLVHPFNKDT